MHNLLRTVTYRLVNGSIQITLNNVLMEEETLTVRVPISLAPPPPQAAQVCMEIPPKTAVGPKDLEA